MPDVVVVGAGPAGSVAALELARRGVRVLVLERSRLPRDKVCAEFLSPGVVREFRRLAVAGVDALLTRPLRSFRVETDGGLAFEGRYAAPGFAVARRDLDSSLAAAAVDAGAELAERSRLTTIEGSASGWRLGVRDPAGERNIACRAVIAADGLHSTVASRLGLRTRLHAPERLALVAHMALPGLAERGEMHVGRAAYCGVAPLSGLATNAANVALVVAASEAPGLRGNVARYFLERLSGFPGLRGRLPEAPIVREILATGPMAVGSLPAPAGVFLAGDAAGFRDPFTGQGIYRAVRGGSLAAAGVSRVLGGHRDATRRFERRRDLEFRGQRAVEGLVQFFLARPGLFNHAVRRLGARPAMADTLLGVTGDWLPASHVLNPIFLSRLAY